MCIISRGIKSLFPNRRNHPWKKNEFTNNGKNSSFLDYYRKTDVRIHTPGEALDMMEKDNLLSAPPAVAAADSKVQHTVEEICEIIDSQPVNHRVPSEHLSVGVRHSSCFR